RAVGRSQPWRLHHLPGRRAAHLQGPRTRHHRSDDHGAHLSRPPGSRALPQLVAAACQVGDLGTFRGTSGDRVSGAEPAHSGRLDRWIWAFAVTWWSSTTGTGVVIRRRSSTSWWTPLR